MDQWPTSADELYERAEASESDLHHVRSSLREYVAWLASPDRGPVIFRSEVVDHLRVILDS